MDLAFSTQAPLKVEVGQSGPSSKQAEPTCSSHASPDEQSRQKTHLFNFGFLGGYPPLPFEAAAPLVFID